MSSNGGPDERRTRRADVDRRCDVSRRTASRPNVGSPTQATIEAGFAKPAAETPGTALFGDRQPRPPSPSGTPPAAPFNANSYSAPSGGHIDPTLLGEFSTAARELGLDQKGGERLLDLHHKGMQAELDHYAKRLADDAGQLERTLPAQDLEAARELINDDRYTPPELRPWLAQWGNHPLVAQLLTRWASAIRNGRRY
jgi:hypothetical protein